MAVKIAVVLVYERARCEDPCVETAAEEVRFISEVDAKFPYGDAQAATALIKRGCAISSNAAFTIPYELAVRPRSTEASVEPETLLLLLDIWAKLFDHPLKALVLRFAQAMVRGEMLPLSVAVDAMKLVSHYPGEFQALNVIYFSQRGTGNDTAVDGAYDDIHAIWNYAQADEGDSQE